MYKFAAGEEVVSEAGEMVTCVVVVIGRIVVVVSTALPVVAVTIVGLLVDRNVVGSGLLDVKLKVELVGVPTYFVAVIAIVLGLFVAGEVVVSASLLVVTVLVVGLIVA